MFSFQIVARGHGISSPPEQLVFDGEDSFGIGSNVQTILYSRDGEERATHIQRSSQAWFLEAWLAGPRKKELNLKEYFTYKLYTSH